MSNSDWAVDPDHTEDHWLEVVDPDGWYSASVKWDGCLEFTRYFNTPHPQDANDENIDSLHICSLDETIERLQSLKAEAIKHFGEGWQS